MEEQIADWICLPNSLKEVSLWPCLHDGKLISCRSNLLDRVVDLEFSVPHLLEDDAKPTNFILSLSNVTSVRAIGNFRWPGKFENPPNISREEQLHLVKEYQEKWREESLSWSEFESALATDPLQIGDANYISNRDVTTVMLGGCLDGEKFDDIYVEVFLRGNHLSTSRSDGKNFSLEEFVAIGEKYWNSFGN